MSNHSSEVKSKIPPEQRRRMISQIIREAGAVNTEELAAQFHVSYMTIWRDIAILEEKGSVERVRGGAMIPEAEETPEPAYLLKQSVHSVEKEAIARYAAQHFVRNNDILIFEAGTTVAAMTKHVTQSNLTVVTNGVQTIVEALDRLPALTLISCGGILRETAHTFIGPQAEKFFQDLSAHTLFLSATGLSIPEGITDPNPLEIQVKRAMSSSAARIVLLMDSSKFGVRSLFPIIPLDAVDVLITDDGAPDDFVEQVRAVGLDVRVVSTGA